MNIEILENIGLTEYESKIYLCLLSHGQLTAYVVADKTGLYRQATYDALNRLKEKGFVNSVKEGKTNYFNAVDPEFIQEYLHNQTDQFTSVLPQLQAMQTKSQHPVVVETYQGKTCLRICFRDIIKTLKKCGGELLATAVDESVNLEEDKIAYDQYERDMLSNGFSERVIVKEGDKGLFQKGTTTYRCVPEKYFNQNCVQIYGDVVNILLWGTPDHLIIIRNKDIADAFRKQFEMQWSMAKAVN